MNVFHSERRSETVYCEKNPAVGASLAFQQVIYISVSRHRVPSRFPKMTSSRLAVHSQGFERWGGGTLGWGGGYLYKSIYDLLPTIKSDFALPQKNLTRALAKKARSHSLQRLQALWLLPSRGIDLLPPALEFALVG